MTTLTIIRSAPPATVPRPRPLLVPVPPLPPLPPLPALPSALPSAPASAGAAGALRLTRRGRVVLLALVLLGALVAFSLGRVSASAAPSGPAPTVTVGAGDTLWSIASRAEPGADPREAVARLAQVNHLASGAVLVPGVSLVLASR